MEEAAELIRAVADLLDSILWPLVVLFIALALRGEIPGMAKRVRRLVVRQGDRSLELELDEARDAALELREDVEEVTRQLPETEGDVVTSEAGETRPSLESGTDPRLTVIALADLIERETRKYLATFADPINWKTRSLTRLLERAGLPESLQRAAAEFRDVRNRIHDRRASDKDVARAFDIGLTILDAIERLPRDTLTVTAIDLPLYSDAAGEQELETVRGVCIKTQWPKSRKASAVYPTTRQFSIGQIVTFEWEFERTWGRTWYRDPDSGAVLLAFDSSAEFAGRPLDEI